MKPINYILLAASVAIITTGMLLMRPPVDIKSTPGGRYTQAPGPGAFHPRRIRVAPVVCWVGFMLVPLGIVWGMTDHADTNPGEQSVRKA